MIIYSKNHLFMKKLLIPISLIIMFLACKNELKISPLKFTSQTLKQEKMEADSSSSFGADVQYLIAEGGNLGVAKAINDTIQNAITATLSFGGGDSAFTKMDVSTALAKFRKGYDTQLAEALKMPVKERFSSSYDYSSAVKAVSQNAKVTVIRINEDIYMGGAHPMGTITSFVFDNQTGKTIKLATLVKNKEALVKILEENFRKEKEIDPKTPLEEVIFADDENKHLPLPYSYELSEDGKGITFIYDSDEVAAHAFGSTIFTVPFESLANCMDFNTIK